jgi:hypothetical protein
MLEVLIVWSDSIEYTQVKNRSSAKLNKKFDEI